MQRLPGQWGKNGQPVDDRGEACMLVAPGQEVVAHRNQHAHVGFEDQATDQFREPRLLFGRAEREQLLELIQDEHRLVVPLPPAPGGRHIGVCVVFAQQGDDCLGVAGELANQCLT